ETGSKRWKFKRLQIVHCLSEICAELPSELSEHLVLFAPGLDFSHKIYTAIDALSVVLTNVLENSFRYSKRPSPVLFVGTSDLDSLHLYIADWGCGISPHQRESIFDPFRRLEEHRDPSRADGSGLAVGNTVTAYKYQYDPAGASAIAGTDKTFTTMSDLRDGSGLGLCVARSLLKIMNSTICLLPLMFSEDHQRYPKTVVKISLPLLHKSATCDSHDSRNGWDEEINGDWSPALASLVPLSAHSDLFRGLFEYLDRCGEPLSCPIAPATDGDGVQSPFLDFQTDLA
ncbi:MAG: ATP-binding protein, partial [bacterium]